MAALTSEGITCPTALAMVSALVLGLLVVGCTPSATPAAAPLAPVSEVARTATSEASPAAVEIATPTEIAPVIPQAPAGPIADGMISSSLVLTSSTLVLTSPAFEDGGTIPTAYTCDGQDTSPALAWTGSSDATASFALVVDDPDASSGTWVHWVIYNIPASARSLPEGIPVEASFSDGTQQGQNSWPKPGYGGPCPPNGMHRYLFNLYALDVVLDLAPDATDKAALLEAMAGHVLAQTTLTGQYER